jgi:hypothetical protein
MPDPATPSAVAILWVLCHVSFEPLRFKVLSDRATLNEKRATARTVTLVEGFPHNRGSLGGPLNQEKSSAAAVPGNFSVARFAGATDFGICMRAVASTLPASRYEIPMNAKAADRLPVR